MRIVLTLQENAMLSDSDIYRAAHLMLHQYGDDAELEAAQCAGRTLQRGDREETLTWFRIWRTIAVMRTGIRGSAALTGVGAVTRCI
jgi:hypothetical protein